MTREEFIREWAPYRGEYGDEQEPGFTRDLDAVLAAEREACATECDRLAARWLDQEHRGTDDRNHPTIRATAAQTCAVAIRARGVKP
jgi:hypothetical protein